MRPLIFSAHFYYCWTWYLIIIKKFQISNFFTGNVRPPLPLPWRASTTRRTSTTSPTSTWRFPPRDLPCHPQPSGPRTGSSSTTLSSDSRDCRDSEMFQKHFFIKRGGGIVTLILEEENPNVARHQQKNRLKKENLIFWNITERIIMIRKKIKLLRRRQVI